MSEQWAQRPRWMLDETPDTECGAYSAVWSWTFWMLVALIGGAVTGLILWKVFK